ncbi:DNA-binding transcriptional activator of the SARP family protein [Bosea sp. LC85]|uniref:AfsR/SARP family transcriptional regulator n=1 Tax=Bosea sp. LC85 TaxID=1502851 RepID=UPI0004E33BAC|nr:hypothetical protein [Bosea sp. LC85]KFC69367.1 DNA-binding transcriptional activator of the SARP family protein [Bosea sp. LC85]
MESSGPLRIRLLGELQLAGGDGRALVLPASRKTRALLGYLVATGQAHRRERLCDLFWDGPDDPRAELRWSLSKIRPLLDWSTGVRLVADRERVSVELGGAAVDLAVVRSRLGGNVSAAPTGALKEAAALFGGEFLDGLDLPLCYRYQEWCMAEREAASRLRLSVLAAWWSASRIIRPMRFPMRIRSPWPIRCLNRATPPSSGCSRALDAARKP